MIMNAKLKVKKLKTDFCDETWGKTGSEVFAFYLD